MNAKNLTLGVFVALTVVFASTTAVEYAQINSLKGTASAITTCIYTTMPAALECPKFFNQTCAISVSYGGPWGISYRGYLGDSESGRLVESGSFYGHGPADESVRISGTDVVGTLLCAQAQKLDSSNSTLVLRIASLTNQTLLAYGTSKLCVADIVV